MCLHPLDDALCRFAGAHLLILDQQHPQHFRFLRILGVPVLNIRTRKQYYHEHLGKMDDPKYMRRNIYKLRLYEKNGIFIGDQLLLTMESSEQPLDMNHFELMIKHYLL